MKRGVYFILLSVGCNAGAPAADPSAAAPRSKTAKQEAQPLEVRQEYPEDEAFSVYAQRAVRWFNAGEYASLRSQEVILLDNWSGLRESGRLFASAQDLFDWVETSDMGVELRLTEGP